MVWAGNHLTYFWCPVSSGRHAFPIAAREEPHEAEVTAYCGAKTSAAELHQDTEQDWVRGNTCMDCWRILADRQRGAQNVARLRIPDRVPPSD